VRRIWVRLWVFDERALVVGGGWGSEFILAPSWREWLLARGLSSEPPCLAWRG